MRRRALLSGLLVGGIAMLSGALAVVPTLENPLEPDDGPDEPQGEDPLGPPSTEPPAPPPLPPGPEEDDEEERPPTEPA